MYIFAKKYISNVSFMTIQCIYLDFFFNIYWIRLDFDIPKHIAVFRKRKPQLMSTIENIFEAPLTGYDILN